MWEPPAPACREQDAAVSGSLFSRWSAAPPLPAKPPAPSADAEVSALMTGIALATGAADILLSVHRDGDDAAPELFASAGTSRLSLPSSIEVARLAGLSLSNRQTRPSFDLDWAKWSTDQASWQILRLPIRSRRARSTVILNLLFSEPPHQSGVAEAVQALRPMFEGYFRLWQRSRSVTSGAAGLRAVLQSMDVGVVLVDRLCRIVFSNIAAEDMMSAGDHLRRSGDRLSAVGLRDAMALQVALSHALGGNSTAGRLRAPLLSIRSSRNNKPLIISVIPAGEPGGDPDAIAAVIYILDPRLDNAKQLQPVCELYGLSPVETRLVCNLTAGASLQEAALAMRIKEQTARGYLKQVFIKTDTKRQADLVRVMLCSLIRTQRGCEPIFLQ